MDHRICIQWFNREGGPHPPTQRRHAPCEPRIFTPGVRQNLNSQENKAVVVSRGQIIDRLVRYYRKTLQKGFKKNRNQGLSDADQKALCK